MWNLSGLYFSRLVSCKSGVVKYYYSVPGTLLHGENPILVGDKADEIIDNGTGTCNCYSHIKKRVKDYRVGVLNLKL